MISKVNFYKMLIIFIAYSATVCSSNQTAYQVSVYLQLHPRGPPVHLCNGVIVQSRLILTTASCVHYKFSFDNSPVVSFVPSMISVISGSSTPFNDEFTLPVADIIVAKDFSFTTGENDLALLRLNGILPLDTRNDMCWITLADDDDYDGPCLANFYVRNSINGAPNFIQSEQLPLLDSQACGATFKYGNEREHDICSFYYLPAGFSCNAIETFQDFNGDRGTGLVCDNKLLGILSTILPVQNKTDCMEKPIKAYYTDVIPHLAWIFDVITEEDLNMLNNGEYISSSPYAGETNAFVKPEAIESDTTTVKNEPVNVTTKTGISAEKDNAAAKSNANFQFLHLIFGSYFILQAINC